MGLRIAVIIRPGIEEARLTEIRAGIDELRREGHLVTPRVTFEPGDGQRLARSAARARYDAVVAVGGDGTLNEVVNGLVHEEDWPRLGVVPVGTANDFAVGLSLPTDLREALRTVATGHPYRVDVARVNGRCFINVSTGGFGAVATESAPAETKRRLGPLAYVITGVREFVDLRPVPGTFEADGEIVYDGDFLLFAVGNARQTGGGSMLTPRAEFGDGKLDLLIVPALPRMDFIALLPDLRAGTHLNSPDVRYLQAARIRVHSTQELNVNADGEPTRARTFDYELLDRSLEVMVPGKENAE